MKKTYFLVCILLSLMSASNEPINPIEIEIRNLHVFNIYSSIQDLYIYPQNGAYYCINTISLEKVDEPLYLNTVTKELIVLVTKIDKQAVEQLLSHIQTYHWREPEFILDPPPGITVCIELENKKIEHFGNIVQDATLYFTLWNFFQENNVEFPTVRREWLLFWILGTAMNDK